MHKHSEADGLTRKLDTRVVRFEAANCALAFRLGVIEALSTSSLVAIELVITKNPTGTLLTTLQHLQCKAAKHLETPFKSPNPRTSTPKDLR